MTTPKRLTMGATVPSPSPDEETKRIAVLQATVEHYLPEFAAGVYKAAESNGEPMILHQDAFAAGYDDDEYTLLGMAIKYAGTRGIAVTVTGRNHESF